MTATANLYPRRRARNFVWTILAYAATALGLSMLAIILAGAAIVREREHGTMDHLLVMPLTPFVSL